ncbi:hypothetical protein EV368DRAFT_78447 [Lentinula lateritia]|nr:hypothetical protein EV368DRAFT_78447 [Lentinula lateritia]
MSWVWGASTLPPVSSAVFSASDSMVISASTESMANPLDPFVRSQMILNNPNSAPLSVGNRIKLYPVHLPLILDDANVGLLQTSSVFAEVTVLDHNNHHVAWRIAGMLPRWTLDAERWQMVTVEESGGGGADVKCKYESFEVFKGILAYVVRCYVGRELTMGVNAMAEGLKRRAEQN